MPRDFHYSRLPRRAWQAPLFGSYVTQQDTDATLARTRIDGGFSFALAAFAIGLGLLAVLDRVGLPDAALKASVGVLVFAEFVIIAAILRTMRPVEFYAGGRALPPPYVGLACAGLAAGLFLPFLPPLPQNLGLNSLAAGFGAGLVCMLFVTGPYLRYRGAVSIADLAGSRFPHPAARIAIAAVIAACSGLVALGGYEIALRAFIAATGIGRPLGASVLGVLLVLLIVPGGLSGVVWLAIGAAVVTLAALGLPQGLSMLHETIVFAPAMARFGAVSGAQQSLPIEPAVVAALALGVGSLAPLFGPAVASHDRGSALRGGLFACAFVWIIGVLGAFTMAHSTLQLDAILVGHDPSQVPAEILAASEQGGISICGVQSDSPRVIAGTCAEESDFNGVLRLQDIGADGGYLLENLPFLQRLGPTLSGLAAVFAIALGIGVAAAGVQCFATGLGHDVFHPKRRRYGLASRRLAYARALAILLIAFCAVALAADRADPRQAIGLALTISATLVAPLLGLSLFKRATSLSALAALLAAALVMSPFVFTHGRNWPPVELSGNAVFAALDGFLAGMFVSFLPGWISITRPAVLASKDEPVGLD